MKSIETTWNYSAVSAGTVEAPGIPACGLAGHDVRTRAAGLSAGWLYFAVGSLLFSGVFALLLVVGRVPPFSGWIGDPDFFRRCLVLHVNLSLLVWFTGFTAALYGRLDGRWIPVLPGLGLAAAVAGVTAMGVSAFIPGSSPVLSNYIPFIDHPLFASGLAAFLVGAAVYYLSGPLADVGGGAEPSGPWAAPAVAAGVKTAALAFLVAVTTFAAAWAATDPGHSTAGYYELVAWGGGHVLQVANVAGMMALWLVLLGSLTGRAVVGAGTAWILFGLLLLPHLAAPLLTLRGTTDGVYLIGFTRLMQFGIFPMVMVFIAFCARALWRGWRDGRLPTGLATDPRLVAWILSLTMTLTGFVLGAMIRGSSTMIPAHYHASIGAVTVAFMAGAFYLIGAPGRTVRRGLISLQLALFGGGQLLFALGFAVGGANGMGRKEYGEEQQLYSIGEYIGVGMMGGGGLIAVAGGVAFLWLFGRAVRRGRAVNFSNNEAST